MRAAACRIGLTFVVLLSGCATAAKRQYLRHLSVTIAPERPGDPTATATALAPGRPPVVTAEASTPRP
jgi:hypothetical protein